MVVSSDRQSKRGDKIPHKKFQVPFKPGFIEETLIRPALEGNKHMIGWNTYKLHLTMCESLLNSTELLQELKDFFFFFFFFYLFIYLQHKHYLQNVT